MPLGGFRVNSLAKYAPPTGSSSGQGIAPTSISNRTFTSRGSSTISSTASNFYPSLVVYGKTGFNPEPYAISYYSNSNWRIRNVRTGTGTSPTVGNEVTLTSMTANGKSELVNWGDSVDGNWNGRGVFFADAGSGIPYRSHVVTSTSVTNGARTGTLANRKLLGATQDLSRIYLWQDNTSSNNTLVELFDQTGDNDNFFTFPADASASVNIRLTQHNMVTASLGYNNDFSSIYGADQSAGVKDALVIFGNSTTQIVSNIFGYSAITTSLEYEGRLLNAGVDNTNNIGVVGYYDTSTYKLDLRPYQPNSTNSTCSLGSTYTVALPSGASKPYIANEAYDGNGQFLIYHTTSTIYIHRILMNGLNDLQLSSAHTISHSNATVTGSAARLGSTNTMMLCALTDSTLTGYGFTYT
jgi:hypothetical protein